MGKRKNAKKNKKYNHYFYIIKNNNISKGKEFYQNDPSANDLSRLSKQLLKNVSMKNNDKEFNFPREYNCDTVAVGSTCKGNLVITTNIKERRKTNEKIKGSYIPVKNPDKKIGTNNASYKTFGIKDKIADCILTEVKKSDIYKKSNLSIEVVESNKNLKSQHQNMIVKSKLHAKKHAEMKMKAYCKKTKQNLENIGISKQLCKNCHKNLKRNKNIDIVPKTKSRKKVTNWDKVDKDEVSKIKSINRKKEKKCKFTFGSHNIKLSKKAFKHAVKDNIKNSFRPSGNVGLISGLTQIVDTIENDNIKPFVEADAFSAKKGVCKNMLNVGKVAYAGVSALECKLGAGNAIGVGASALSASAHAEYGLNNSVGANISLIKVQGNVGPAQVGVGVNLDTNASLGVNGIGASFLGMGFNFGPRMQLKTPFFDFSISLF